MTNDGRNDEPQAVSRRALMRGALGAAVALPLAGRVAPAQGQPVLPLPPQDPAAMIATLTNGVYLNANENPLGPCDAALKALAGLEKLGGRYGFTFGGRVSTLFAEQNGLKRENVVIHPGSFVPLATTALAFASDDRPLAYFEPTFNDGFLDSKGRPTTRQVTLPLAGDFAMDLRKLLATAPNAGVYYVCNPNNPTGLVTPRAEIEWLLANKPAGSVVLVDEAYIHYTTNAQSCLDLVARGADVIVLRTFSKIYGLAGMRVGLVAARRDLLERLDRFGVNIPPMPGMVAAEASLLDPALVPQRRAYTAAVRADVLGWLNARGFRTLPSETSFAMVHVGRPGNEVQKALEAYRVFTSGTRKHMDDWFRITFGSPAEMDLFKAAFAKVMELA